MTNQQFRAALERLGFTQVGFARDIGVNPRTVRSWALSEHPVPQVVAKLIEALEKPV